MTNYLRHNISYFQRYNGGKTIPERVEKRLEHQYHQGFGSVGPVVQDDTLATSFRRQPDAPKLTLAQGTSFAFRRLQSLQMRYGNADSRDGNCLFTGKFYFLFLNMSILLLSIFPKYSVNVIFSALVDQMKHYSTHFDSSDMITTADGMRQFLCNSLLDTEELHQFMSDDIEGPINKYYDRMIRDGEYGDHVMLKTAATVFNTKIVVHPVFPPNAQRMSLPIPPMHQSNSNNPDWNLLFYDDINFISPHYRSIWPRTHQQDGPINSTVLPNNSLQALIDISISPVRREQQRREAIDTPTLKNQGIN